MQGAAAPEVWYLSEKGLAKIKESAPILSRYAVARLPCGGIRDRIPHELLVTESLLNLMEFNAVVEYKPEWFLKRELALERIARERRNLNETEIQKVLENVKGEETGDFKVKIFDPDPFFDSPDVKEIECETAVNYRKKVILNKPAGMHWYAGSQGQADLIEANKTDCCGYPIVLGEVVRPFFTSVINSYHSGKNNRQLEFEEFNSQPENQNEEIRDHHWALEKISELVGEDMPNPGRIISEIRHALQQHTLWKIENKVEIDRQLADGSMVLSAETTREIRNIIRGKDKEISVNAGNIIETTNPASSEVEDAELPFEIVDREFEESFEVNVLGIKKGVVEEERGAKSEIYQAGFQPGYESNESSFSSGKPDGIRLETFRRSPAEQSENGEQNEKFDDPVTHQQQNYEPEITPLRQVGKEKSHRQTRIRMSRNAGRAVNFSKPKSKPSCTPMEVKILGDIDRADALTRGALAKLRDVRVNEISSAVQRLCEKGKIEFADVNINPGTRKHRPSRLFWTGNNKYRSWAERVGYVLLSKMIEQFHNQDYRLLSPDGWDNRVTFEHRITPETNRILVLIDTPQRSTRMIFHDYEMEIKSSGGVRNDIMIVTYSSKKAAEIRQKLPHIKVCDAEKNTWI